MNSGKMFCLNVYQSSALFFSVDVLLLCNRTEENWAERNIKKFSHTSVHPEGKNQQCLSHPWQKSLLLLLENLQY